MRIGDLLSMLKLAHHHARMYAYLAGKRIDPQLRVQRMNPGDEASQPLLIDEEIDSEQVGSLLGVWLLLEPLRASAPTSCVSTIAPFLPSPLFTCPSSCIRVCQNQSIRSYRKDSATTGELSSSQEANAVNLCVRQWLNNKEPNASVGQHTGNVADLFRITL